MSLDEEHSIYQYGEKGTLTLNTWGNTTNPSECVVTFASARHPECLVALRWRGASSGWIGGPAHVTISGGDAVGFYFLMNKSLPTTYPFYADWVVFEPVTDADEISGDYGLNLYDSSGNFIWSSNVKSPIRLRTIYPYPLLPRGATRIFEDPTYPTTDYYYVWVPDVDYDKGDGSDTRLIWEITY